MSSPTISALLDEQRRYPAPAPFAASANVTPAVHAELQRLADADPIAFWEAQAERLDWTERWHTAHTWVHPAGPSPLPDSPLPELVGGAASTSSASAGSASVGSASAGSASAGSASVGSASGATWFAGVRLNAAVNCVDRHVDAGRGDKVAFHFEAERGDRRTLTYAELQREVAKAANALVELGIVAGDRVVVYLPVLLETVIVTLAIARLGAVHSLVFGGFSAEALRFRVEDTGAKLLVTTDGQFRRGAAVPVKAAADAAVDGVASIEHVLVIRRTGDETPGVPFTPGRDVWWHEIVDRQPDVHAAQSFDAEHPLFVIYTSGTTGKPKGLVHTTGGYLTHAAYTQWAVFDVRPDDVYWCTADLAWVTAHTYELYGPLLNGITSVIYEGTPDTPHPGRHFEVIERYGVTIYYTAPTLVRSLMTWFPDGVPRSLSLSKGGSGTGYDLSSIRLLGSVGEAINPEAWAWFREQVGAGSAPIVDTWWQSETGAAMMAPLPGVATLKPGSSLGALPGIRTLVVDERGERVPNGAGGYLVAAGTWPGMARTVWGDPDRYRASYWERFADRGYFFSGDGARYDADGDIWLLGRVDDVINVSGHRLSTIEIESALVSHPAVGEAGAVGVSDALTGEAVAAFVVASGSGADAEALRAHVASVIGPIAKPREIHVVPELPKTRSGKIMRRLLVDLAEGRPLGDTTSLQDETVPARIADVLAGR